MVSHSVNDKYYSMSHSSYHFLGIFSMNMTTKLKIMSQSQNSLAFPFQWNPLQRKEFELSKLKTCFLVLLGEFIVLRQVFPVSIVQRRISMVTNTPNSTHFIMIMIIIRQQLSYKRAKTPIFAMVTDVFGDIFNLIDTNIPIMALCRLLYSNNWSKSTNFKNFNSYFCSNCFVFYKLLLLNNLKSY